MKNIIKNSLLTSVVLSSVLLSGTSFAGSVEIVKFPALDILQDTSVASFKNVSGFHRVNPYLRNDGTFVSGHWRSNPDNFCWNNLSGC